MHSFPSHVGISNIRHMATVWDSLVRRHGTECQLDEENASNIKIEHDLVAIPLPPIVTAPI